MNRAEYSNTFYVRSKMKLSHQTAGRGPRHDHGGILRKIIQLRRQSLCFLSRLSVYNVRCFQSSNFVVIVIVCIVVISVSSRAVLVLAGGCLVLGVL